MYCQVVNKNSCYWENFFYNIKVLQRGLLDPLGFGVFRVLQLRHGIVAMHYDQYLCNLTEFSLVDGVCALSTAKL